MEVFFVLVVISLLCFICAGVSRRPSEPNADLEASKVLAASALARSDAYDEAQKEVIDFYHKQVAEEDERFAEFWRKQYLYRDNWERYIAAIKEKYDTSGDFFMAHVPGMAMFDFRKRHAVLFTDKPVYRPYQPTPPDPPKVWESAVKYGYYERFPLVDPRDFDKEENNDNLR